MVPKRVNCYFLNLSHGKKKTSPLKPSIFFISIWFRHADLQRHQFLLQAFLLGKSARQGSKWGIWTRSFRTKKHPPYLATYCQKKYLCISICYINSCGLSLTHILHVHFEFSPVVILVSPREKLRFTIYPPPFAPRPLRRCGPVQPWSLVNQRIAAPTNSSRFPPQINNQGGQGRVYPESVYPWYVAFLLWSLGILGGL